MTTGIWVCIGLLVLLLFVFYGTIHGIKKENNRLRDFIDRVASQYERRITTLEGKANWEPPDPPSIDVIVKKLVAETEDYKSRCPRCNMIIREDNKPKYCPGCGESFFKEPTPKKLPRVLSSFKKTWRPFNNRPFNIYAFLKWQCLECNREHEENWLVDELDGRHPFIHVMSCDKCKVDVGDLIIDPILLEANKPWAVDVRQHGSHKLTDYKTKNEPTIETMI